MRFFPAGKIPIVGFFFIGSISCLRQRYVVSKQSLIVQNLLYAGAVSNLVEMSVPNVFLMNQEAQRFCSGSVSEY